MPKTEEEKTENSDNPDHYDHSHYSKVKRMEGIASDKVNINVGGGEGGGYGGGMAAVIAALGNRNQGDNLVPLLAALGNRNDNHRGDDGFGFGGVGALLLLALLGGRGFGHHGGGRDNDCERSVFDAAVLSKLGSVEGAVPQVTSNVRESVLESTGSLKDLIAQFGLNNCAEMGRLALGIQQGFSNTKDAIQAGIYVLSKEINETNQNVSEQGCRGRETTKDEAEKTRALIIAQNTANLQRELTVAQNALVEERHNRKIDDVRVSMNQTVNQNQSQAQQQQQFQLQSELMLSRLLAGFGNQLMVARQGQDIVNLGTMTASGTQAAANTQVR